MAILRQRLHRKNASGSYDTIHLETSAAAITGTLGVAHGGTGVTANPSLQVNLASTSAANVFAAAPRPGVSGTLGVGNGGTGQTSISGLKSALGLNTTSAQVVRIVLKNQSIPSGWIFAIILYGEQPTHDYDPYGIGVVSRAGDMLENDMIWQMVAKDGYGSIGISNSKRRQNFWDLSWGDGGNVLNKTNWPLTGTDDDGTSIHGESGPSAGIFFYNV